MHNEKEVKKFKVNLFKLAADKREYTSPKIGLHINTLFSKPHRALALCGRINTWLSKIDFNTEFIYNQHILWYNPEL